jgi:hypothetical protein
MLSSLSSFLTSTLTLSSHFSVALSLPVDPKLKQVKSAQPAPSCNVTRLRPPSQALPGSRILSSPSPAHYTQRARASTSATSATSDPPSRLVGSKIPSVALSSATFSNTTGPTTLPLGQLSFPSEHLFAHSRQKSLRRKPPHQSLQTPTPHPTRCLLPQTEAPPLRATRQISTTTSATQSTAPSPRAQQTSRRVDPAPRRQRL